MRVFDRRGKGGRWDRMVGQRTVGDELGIERGGGTTDKKLALLNVILPRDVDRPLLELLKSLKHATTRQYLYIPSEFCRLHVANLPTSLPLQSTPNQENIRGAVVSRSGRNGEEEMQCYDTYQAARLPVALDDHLGVHALLDEGLCLLHEFVGEDDDRRSTVTSLKNGGWKEM